ncbi:MAG: hypothetical protein RUDDFDWM_000423 [Candidatus Fervidibacterota bacterium]
MQCSKRCRNTTFFIVALLVTWLCNCLDARCEIITSLKLSLRKVSATCIELLSNNEVILRVRHENARLCEEAANKLFKALHEALASLATDKAVTVEKAVGGYSIYIGGRHALFVDHAMARSSRSLPQALANLIATRLKELLKRPYLVAPVEKVLIGVNEAYVIALSGTATGEWKFSVTPRECAHISFDAATKTLRISALKPADGRVSISCGEASLSLTLKIMERAMRLLRKPIAMVYGAAPKEFITEAAINALLNSIELQPKAELAYELFFTSRDTDERLFTRLKARGASYLPFDAEVEIQTLRIPLAMEFAKYLSVSNDPERIHTEQVLKAGVLTSSFKPMRLLYHHVNVSGRKLWLRLELFNSSEAPAKIVLRFARGGPTSDEIHAGYSAVNSFLRSWFNGTAFIIEVLPKTIYVADELAVPNGNTVTGIWEIAPIYGEGLGYQLRAVAEPSPWRLLPLVARTITAPPRVSHFAEPMKRVIAKHIIGGNWTFVHIGREPIKGLEGEHLHGNYGVIYHITVSVENKSEFERPCELVFSPNAGVARFVGIVNGKLLSSPTMRENQEYVLRKWYVSPLSTEQIDVYTMPIPASYYPVSLIIRSR